MPIDDSVRLPPLCGRAAIQQRLRAIFPEGTPNRNYCVRDIAASTVFAMLYVGAVEGTGRFLAPKQVYRMTDRQARTTSEADRLLYARSSLRGGFAPRGKRWYADNTREPIRDETLRDGLIALGAVVVRGGIPTTSGRPRYALERAFAALFDPARTGRALDAAIGEWRASHLTASALARVTIVAKGVVSTTEGVLIRFPNGETRRMAAGPSSVIAKAVIEEFTSRFMGRAGVIWLSDSQTKVVARDDELATRLGLRIDVARNLPDLLLVDLAPAAPLFVFVEIVATNGAITEARQAALRAIATDAGFPARHVAFVSAFLDRASQGFRRNASRLAWGSFAWFASEPERIIVMQEPGEGRLLLDELLGVRS